MRLKKVVSAIALTSSMMIAAAAQADNQIYTDFPITVDGYKGTATASESYKGQIARHVLHNSLKKLAAKGNGQPNAELKAEMMAYFNGSKSPLAIIDPASKDGFPIAQVTVDDLSKGKNLADKAYKGTITGWPNNMTGAEVLSFMIDKASAANKGYDPVNGLDYPQLISKFAMGAVFYNQAVDSYLDEKLAAGTKPNDQPYKEGAAYTGKEHAWDEAFGYFGAPAHALTLDTATLAKISKQDADYFSKADYNQDGKVDLYKEMIFAHASYAISADSSGKTNYFNSIMQAFIDGRKLITRADGKALTDAQRAELIAYADTIASNWEKVIAEATFKYAGEVYEDLQKIQIIVDANGNVNKAFKDYSKHWGELKGFSLALQTGRQNLGETATKLNRLIGFSPVLLGDTQVTGIDAQGQYQQSASISMTEYKLHMLKVQKLMVDAFGVKARSHDALAGMDELAAKLGESKNAEND